MPVTKASNATIAKRRAYKMLGEKWRKKSSGTGKKNRVHQAEEVNSSLNNTCFMARNPWESSKYNWLLDSCTTSHVCGI